jgi:hypothetical protein
MPPGSAGAPRDPYRRTVVGDVLDTDVNLVTVHKLLGHANVQTTAQDDGRWRRAKKKVVGTLHVPYRRRKQRLLVSTVSDKWSVTGTPPPGA